MAAKAKERRRCRRSLLRSPRPTGRVFFRGRWPRASASTPGVAERVFFRDRWPRASASTPGTAERVFFRDRWPRASASTPGTAERVFFRDRWPRASASTRVWRSGFSSAACCRGHPLLRRIRRSGFSSATVGRGHPRGGRAVGADQPSLEQAPRRGLWGIGPAERTWGLTWVCCGFWMGTWAWAQQ